MVRVSMGMDSATILALEEVWLQKSPTEEEKVITLKSSKLGQCPKSEQVDLGYFPTMLGSG